MSEPPPRDPKIADGEPPKTPDAAPPPNDDARPRMNSNVRHLLKQPSTPWIVFDRDSKASKAAPPVTGGGDADSLD
jgi:hypothetical protein